jgi:N-acetylneuraminic acid mutarotase
MQRIPIRRALAGAALTLGLATPPALLAAEWELKAPLPAAMSEVSVTTDGQRVYVLGGTLQEGDDPMQAEFASSKFLAYDPDKNSWQELAPLPQTVTHIGTAYYDGHIFAVGGFETLVHMGAKSAAYSYDVAANKWAELPALPIAVGSPAVAAVGGKVHVIAGRDAENAIDVPIAEGGPTIQIAVGGTLSAHQIFDPATGSWEMGAALPEPARDHIAVAVLDDKIHLLGGRVDDTDQNVADHVVYDPATDTWDSAAPLPEARSAGAASAVDGKIVYAGGECRPGGQPFTPNAFDEVFQYDAASGDWIELPSLPSGRHGFGGATAEQTIYFPAGAPVCGGGALTDMLSMTIE